MDVRAADRAELVVVVPPPAAGVDDAAVPNPPKAGGGAAEVAVPLSWGKTELTANTNDGWGDFEKLTFQNSGMVQQRLLQLWPRS